MGHSTGSGRSEVRYSRGVEPNSRLGRNWAVAAGGDADQVVREYTETIRERESTLRRTRNGFRRTALTQEIDVLREELDRIRKRFFD